MLSLHDLVRDLGSPVLDLALAPRGTDVQLAGLVVYDPLDPLDLHQGDVVLGIGLAPGPSIAALFAGMHAAEAAALVVKAPRRPLHQQMLTEAEQAGVALLTVPLGASWTQIVLLMRQAMSRGEFGASTETFGGVLAGDLFAVANAVAAVVDAPVTIEDPQSRVIAFSNRQEEADSASAVTILGRQIPESYLRQLRQRGVYRQLGKERRPLYIDRIADDVQPRVAIAVRAGDEVIGSVWATVKGPLTPEREAAFVEAAGFVSLHLLRHRLTAEAQRGLQAELVACVLKGDSLAGEAAQRLGLRESAYRVLAIGFDDHEDGNEDIGIQLARCQDLLALHVSPTHRRAVTAVLAREVYALLPLSGGAADQSLSPVRELAEDFVSRASGALRRRVLVGIGGFASALSTVPDSRSEADQVLRVLRRKAGPRSTAEISDVQSDVLLMWVGDLCSGDALLDRGPLAALQANDTAHHTAYVETLRAYLDSFGDFDSAAAQLGVHPNTVRYRMRHLQEVGGIDLHDSDARLALTLQLRLLADSHTDIAPATP